MRLTGDSFKQLRDALNAAFDENRLRAMLRMELDVDLDAIVAPGPRITRIEDLIRWADYNTRTQDLLTAAQTDNPSNRQLAALELEYTAGQPDPYPPQRADRDDSDISFDQKGQTVSGYQVNIGRMQGGHVGDKISGDKITYILPGEQPPRFAGVPDFPRYGLFGRDNLLQALVARLTTGQQPISLAISGAGGVGKTALAVAAAYHKDLLDHFTDGVLWAFVGPGGDPRLELGRWAAALGIDPAQYPEPGDLKRAVKNAIGNKKILLVIDDIWQPEHAELLRCGGLNCAHLLTTRNNSIARAFAGRANALKVPDLEPDPAFELLQTIADEVVAADEKAARELVRQVGGLPLAVELLGGFLNEGGAPDPDLFPDLGRKKLQAMADPAKRLQQAKTKLEDMSGAQIRLDDLLALSLQDFNEKETESFYALGAFAPKPATFGRTAAEAVSGADPAFLSRLVNRNLLEIEGQTLTLHQALHDLAHTRMKQASQVRHSDYYLTLVNEDTNDWQRIDPAYEQIRWAWERIVDDDCIAWVYALRDYQVKRGYWTETLTWQNRGLENAHNNDNPSDLTQLLNNLGSTYNDLGRRTEALALFDKALPIAREVGDRATEAMILTNMGLICRVTGLPERAMALFEEARSNCRETGDRQGEAATLNNIGQVYTDMGRPEQALALYEEALPILREVGDLDSEVAILNNMGLVYQDTGRPAEALALHEKGLPIIREVGDLAGEAAILNNIGEVYRVMGRPEDALALYEEVLTIVRELGQRNGEAATLNNMALVNDAIGRQVKALALYEEALPIMREVDDRTGEALALNGIAIIHHASGRTAEALALYEEALSITREVGNRSGEGATLNNMAAVYRDTGRSTEALALFEMALLIRREVGNRYGEAETLNNMAGIYRDTGRSKEALTLYEEALPIVREASHIAGEAMILSNMAVPLVQIERISEAIEKLESAIAVMRDTALTHDASGTTIAQYEVLLRVLREEIGNL